jgi:hypothetical protein
MPGFLLEWRLPTEYRCGMNRQADLLESAHSVRGSIMVAAFLGCANNKSDIDLPHEQLAL